MISFHINQQNLDGGYTKWVQGNYPLDSLQGSKLKKHLLTVEGIA
jgi:hypothetical protein